MRRYLYRLFRNLFIIPIWTLGAVVSVNGKPVVVINFYDTATINDTDINLNDISTVSADSDAIAREVALFSVGAGAPAGYSRFVETKDLLMYRLKPSFKDVDIKVVRDKRVLVKTAYIEKKIQDFKKEINDYARQQLQWKAGQWKFSVNNPEASWKCLNAPFSVKVLGLESPAAKGHVQLQFIVEQYGRTIRIPLSCTIEVTTPVIISNKTIARGQIIDLSDIEEKAMNITNFSPTPYFNKNEVVGKKAIRTIPVGTILHDRMVTEIPVLVKGDGLNIQIIKGSVIITVAAIARENGHLGQKIWVENANTHRLVRVVVKDKNTATLL